MRTKEIILEGFTDKYLIGGLGPKIKEDILMAMSEYAKEIVVDFNNWIVSKGYKYNGSERLGYWYQGIFTETPFSTEQLFDIYLKQK